MMAAAAFITGIVAYPALPLVAASHWDIQGTANGYLPRFWAAFLMPLMMAIVATFWAVLPAIDPLAKGFRGFRYVYDFFIIILMAFLAYVYAFSLGVNLGWQVNLSYIILPALGVLMFVLGALLPLVARNWFFGIRTPWSLSSDANWDATHRFASRLFELAGFVTLASFFVFPTVKYGFLASVFSIVGAAVASVIYSYIFSRHER